MENMQHELLNHVIEMELHFRGDPIALAEYYAKTVEDEERIEHTLDVRWALTFGKRRGTMTNDWTEIRKALLDAKLLDESQLDKFEDTLSSRVTLEQARAIDLLHSLMCGEEGCTYEAEETVQGKIEGCLNLWDNPAHAKWLEIYNRICEDEFIERPEQLINSLTVAAEIAERNSSTTVKLAYLIEYGIE